MLSIDPTPAPAAMQELIDDLHPDDAAELAAAGATLQHHEGVSYHALRNDGRLVALFGLQPHPVLPGAGIPWMLCTRHLEAVPRRRMAAVSVSVVHQWRQQCRLLQNMVHRRNERAMRFVQWLGFTIDRRPFGPGGEFFVFTWEA